MRKTLNRPVLYTTLIFSFFSVLASTNGCSKSEPPASQSTDTAPGKTDAKNDKGVGPVTTVNLEALDAALAAQGKAVFAAKCTSCHKIDEKYVGPALKGVTGRRQPEWIMNMILNPAEMTTKDPIAKDLLAQFMTTMSFQNVSPTEARKILEFFRQNDAAK